MSKLYNISQSINPNRLGDVVFVHGLGGEGWYYWHADSKRKKREDKKKKREDPELKNRDFWLAWLDQEFPELGFWSLEYQVEPFHLFGNSMPLEERSENVTDRLYQYEIGQRPLIFVTHSLGGILVKQILYDAVTKSDNKSKSILEQTKGIVFLSTPHAGSGLANFVKYLGKILGPSVSIQELLSNESKLWNLNKIFSLNNILKSIPIKVYYETEETYLNKWIGYRIWAPRWLVVNRASATPSGTSIEITPVDRDHITICQPPDREDQVYSGVKIFLAEHLDLYSINTIESTQRLSKTAEQIPTHLRHSEANLVGRESELSKIHEQLKEHQCLFITGMPGIGKSELALTYAHLYYLEYRGGKLWIDASSDIAQQIVDYVKDIFSPATLENLNLSISGEADSKISSCWQQWPLPEEQVLIIIDDIEDLEDFEKYLIGVEARFKFLLTSQNGRVGCYKKIELTPSSAISKQIIKSILKPIKHPNIQHDWAKLEVLCERLGHLPLTVQSVGVVLKDFPEVGVEDLLKELEADGLTAEFIKTAEPGTIAKRGVRAAFEITWKRLSDKAKHFGVFLSLFAATPFPRIFMHNNLLSEVSSCVRELQIFYLLTCTDTDRKFYQLHKLIHDFFRSKTLERTQDIDELKRQACQSIIAAVLNLPRDTSPEYFQEMDSIRLHVKSVMEISSKHFPPDNSFNVANARKEIGLIYFFDYEYQSALENLEKSRRIRLICGDNNSLELAALLTYIAATYLKLFEINRKTDQIAAASYAELAEGYAAESVGLYEKLHTSPEDKDYLTARTTLTNVRWKKATDSKVLKSFESTLLNLIHIKQNFYPENQYDIAEMHSIIGGYYEKMNCSEKSLTHYLKSLRLYRKLCGKHHVYVAVSYNNISNYYRESNNLDRAESLLIKAIDIVKILKQPAYLSHFEPKLDEIRNQKKI